MDIRDHFERVRRSLENDCTGCGLCVEECPTFGRGVLEGADAEEIAADRITMASSGAFHEQAYLCARACMRCGACREVCPVDIDAAQANHVVRLAAARGDAEASDRYEKETAGLQTMLPANPANWCQVRSSVVTMFTSCRQSGIGISFRPHRRYHAHQISFPWFAPRESA